VEVDGAFPESGKSTDLTDEGGRFEARAPLGKISSKLDWGRVHTMSPLSLHVSPRSVTKQTKIIDAVQANVRVEADGYKPFVGRVRAKLLSAGSFSMTLDDVWLAPSDAQLTSFTPERRRLEIIEGLTVEPAVAAPGEKVKITLAAELPLERGYKYKAYATSTASRHVPAQVELKADKPKKGEPVSNRVVFSKEVTLPKSSVDRWTEIGFFLVWDDSVVLRQRDTKALLQVVRTPEERAAAEKVVEGFSKTRLGYRDEALQSYAAARKARPDYTLAHLLYGDLCLALDRPRDAQGAYRQLVQIDPRDYEYARSRYAQALFEGGDPKGAIEQTKDAEKTLGKQPIPADVWLIRARAFAAQGDFEEADKALASAGKEHLIPDSVLTEINLKRMAAAVKEKPDDPDVRLSYARVLHGARRREEAVQQIRKAVTLDPGQPWPFLDLGQQLWDLGRRQEAIANLKHAVDLAPDNLEAVLALGDAYRKSNRFQEALPLYGQVVEKQPLNLPARHHHAILLYAAGKLPEARKELLEVMNQARDKGDLRDNGIPIPGPGLLGTGLYFGPKRRLVHGFSVPEAAADAAILEALQDLDRHPDNGLLWQNIGHALLELDMPSLALTALKKSREHDPGVVETRFLIAVALRRLNQKDAARNELLAVIQENPLHPRARLELAQLYTDDGKLDLAQAEILAHTKNYPYERLNRPAQSSFGG
jgi:tetratricopeptide (TPR) repeat protein